MGYILALRHNILPFTKSRKQLKTDEDTLLGLDDPLASVVLKYRHATKLLSTYIKPWLGKKRAYTNFRMDLSTSRLASFDRNIQNIPPAVREIFAPDSGMWTWIDWSQIEMRIFAYITQDPVMLDAYRTGKDIHSITQEALWPGSDLKDESIRGKAKEFNFSMVFFASVRTLSINSRLPMDLCAKYRMTWLDLYHEAHRWMENQARIQSEWVETLFGRRLRLPNPLEATEGHINKCKINYPVQGTAAGVVARGMIQCDDLSYDQAAQVHDELLIDGDVDPPDSLAHILPGIDLPFKVHKSPVWV